MGKRALSGKVTGLGWTRAPAGIAGPSRIPLQTWQIATAAHLWGNHRIFVNLLPVTCRPSIPDSRENSSHIPTHKHISSEQMLSENNQNITFSFPSRWRGSICGGFSITLKRGRGESENIQCYKQNDRRNIYSTLQMQSMSTTNFKHSRLAASERNGSDICLTVER